MRDTYANGELMGDITCLQLDLNAFEFGVLMALAKRVDNKTNECFGSHSDISIISYQSISRVKKSINGLIGAGLITKSKQGGRDGKSNTYQLSHEFLSQIQTVKNARKKVVGNKAVLQLVTNKPAPQKETRRLGQILKNINGGH